MRSDPSTDGRPGVTSAGNNGASRLDLPLPDWHRRRQPPYAPHFVIQHHAATSDHYDFRLAVDDVLVSWAVPKGPSTNPKDRRMARRTEDHPLDYETFEGVIPKGQYGAGRVIVWDRGTYINESQYDMSEGLKRGHLSFWLDGQKLRGGYALTRIRDGVDETWLLVKKSDEFADARSNSVRDQPESVLSGRTLADLS
jgi:DNA ligase D-like protein (predicted 3'-phosphoesterase)